MPNRRTTIKWAAAVAGGASLLYGATLGVLLYIPNMTCCPVAF
jgi:hypothetical protein